MEHIYETVSVKPLLARAAERESDKEPNSVEVEGWIQQTRN
jgi:hypothetical protein